MDVLGRVIKEANQYGCWALWGVSLNHDGYARQRINGRTWRMHRWMYEHMVGPIEAGMELDHVCRVRWCVNPDHLRQATRQEHALITKAQRAELGLAAPNLGMQYTKRDACRQGHVRTEDNTYTRADGYVVCMHCWWEKVYRPKRIAKFGKDPGPWSGKRRKPNK